MRRRQLRYILDLGIADFQVFQLIFWLLW